jgi:hypothetical protein
MTEPDEALEGFRKWASTRYPKVAAYIEAGACDGDDTAEAYRAGQAASAERIKALEEENAALEEMAGNLQVRMSDMLERLHERYPEDFVWLKEADQ